MAQNLASPQKGLHEPPLNIGSNTRPLTIFFSYLTTCFCVGAFIVRKLFKRYSALRESKTATLPPQSQIWLFVALAVGSILTTWTSMFQYFEVSYQDWLIRQTHTGLDPQERYWGLWLKETGLFREAWETVIVGDARYWWSHQIFFYALILGLYLEQKGARRGITYTWAFMLLGQIVAISFATNLYLLAVLLSPHVSPPSLTSKKGHGGLGLSFLNVITIIVTGYSVLGLEGRDYSDRSAEFMPLLMAPHVALIVLPVLRIFLPAKWFMDDYTEFSNKAYKFMIGVVLGDAALMLARNTSKITAQGGAQAIWGALWSHPASSSVGFDVIFCTLSWICWWLTQRGAGDNELARARQNKKGL